jgi:hypothetical protein
MKNIHAGHFLPIDFKLRKDSNLDRKIVFLSKLDCFVQKTFMPEEDIYYLK